MADDDEMDFDDLLHMEETFTQSCARDQMAASVQEHERWHDDVPARALLPTSSFYEDEPEQTRSPAPANFMQSPSPASAGRSTGSSSCQKRSPERKVEGQEAPSRKRLRGKQAPPAGTSHQDNSPANSCRLLDHAVWGGLEHASVDELATGDATYQKMYYKLRAWLWSYRDQWARLQKRSPELVKCGLQCTTGWGSSPKWAKSLVVSHFLDKNEAPPTIRALYTKAWTETNERQNKLEGSILRVQGKSVLITYNGQWGVISIQDCGGGKPDEVLDVTALVLRVRESRLAQRLWSEFYQLADQLVRIMRVTHWTACMEICTKTWTEERQVRLHAHLFLKRRDGKMDFKNLGNTLPFHSCFPVVSEWYKVSSRSSACSWMGAFYCQAPKIGGVFSAGNVEPFVGYPVNGSWIFSLLQQQKIGFADAKEWLIKTGRGLARNLHDINTWRNAQAELAEREYVASAQRKHLAENKAWRQIEKFEAWKAASLQPMLRRKKFCVLVGPTGLGKTEFIKAQFGPDRTLELNAAGMTHPCLTEYHSDQHLCILWDEAEASLISENCKLFQCPAAFVKLGFSPTGAMCYTVMFNKSVMVINSNRWHEQLAKLEPGDRDWVEKNQAMIEVTEPLWIE